MRDVRGMCLIELTDTCCVGAVGKAAGSSSLPQTSTINMRIRATTLDHKRLSSDSLSPIGVARPASSATARSGSSGAGVERERRPTPLRSLGYGRNPPPEMIRDWALSRAA